MKYTAVFVNQGSDQQFLRKILRKRKHIQFYPYDFLKAFEYTCQAIIVCHRACMQHPNPRLPNKYNTSRLVVLSDCEKEKCIVDTLLAGANHYIDLNASETVLTARIDAALRNHLQRESRVLKMKPYTFNKENRTVFYGDELLGLSPREFELAYYLFSNRTRVVSDAELMTSIWTLPPSLDTRRIDTSICRIKKKMMLNTDYSDWAILRLSRTGYQVITNTASST